MSHSNFQAAVNHTFDEQQSLLETQTSFLGKNIDEVLKEQGVTPGKDRDQIVADAVTQLQQADASTRAAASKDDTWYTGSASLAGAIRGTCDAGVYFGDSGNYKFSGSMWTSPIVAAGGGAGAWSLVPRNGQEMNFTWWGASVSGGAVNILWDIDGTIVGSMAIAVAGVGGGGGNGSGKWTKGN